MRLSKAFTAGVMALLAVTVAMGAATAVAEPSSHSPAGIDGPLADHADPSAAFAIALQPDGSARVHITYTFDLADEARAEAFEEIRTNETVKTEFEERFRTRLSEVADSAATVTGREMAIRDVELSVRTFDETGIVELSLVWEGLAAVEGDRLVITEPFASGFESDRPVDVIVPDGYEVESVTPEPSYREASHLHWEAGTDLSGFEVVLGSSEAEDGNSNGGSGPGFDIIVALAALVAVALMAIRKRSSNF